MTDIPLRLTRRPRDARGFVIPFAQFITTTGKPDFRVLDEGRVAKVARQRRCGLCGEPMRKGFFFIGGPLCVASGYFHDPAMHRECAVYALQRCPHLARSKGKYAPLPEKVDGAALLIHGEMSDIKAEWFALMRTSDYASTRTDTGMILIKAVMPWLEVERWREGKPMETTE